MILSIVNQKGGTAKTTTTVNLATGLSEKGNKVLLIDLDPQGSLSFCFGISENENEITHVLSDEMLLEEVIHRGKHIDVIPSTIALADLELSLPNYENRTFLLKNILWQVEDRYDFILIDCPPSLSLLTINALTASEKVIVPIQLSVLGIQGLDLILNTIHRVKTNYNSSLKLAGVLPVMVDMRRKLSLEVIQYIHDNYEVNVYATKIRNSVRVMEAPSFTQSVLEFAPKCNASIDYRKFTMEFLEATNRH